MQSKATYDEFEIQTHFSAPEYKMKIGMNPQGLLYLLIFLEGRERGQLEQFAHIQQMEHPSILQLIQVREGGIYTKKKGHQQHRSCLIYEYPQGGELYEYLLQTGRFNENQARLYFRQILDGIIHIHKQGLYHGELITENVYFKDPKTIKIGEYGISFVKRRILQFSTPEWNEINDAYPQNKDIFCLGMILYSIVVGCPPFPKTDKSLLFYKAFYHSPENFWNKVVQKVPSISPQFKDLIHGMLAEDPEIRYSLSDIFNHQWTTADSEFTPEMFRDFTAKQEKIEQCIRRAKLYHQLQKQQQILNATQPKLSSGIGMFYRSQTALQTNDIDEQIERINQKFTDIQKNKSIRTLSNQFMKADSYYIHLDPYIILFLLIEKLEAKNSQFKVRSQSQANFKLIISSDNDIIIQVELVQIEDEIICVTFKKLQGELFNYMEKVREFHQLIDKILSVMPQTQELGQQQ